MNCAEILKAKLLKTLRNNFFWFSILIIVAIFILYISNIEHHALNIYMEISVAMFSFAGLFLVQGILHRYNKIKFLQALRDPLIKWAGDVLDELNDLNKLAEIDPLTKNDYFADVQKKTLNRLQLLISKGRLLIPNDNRQEYGKSKISFRRGYRPLPLDVIMVAHDFVESLESKDLKDLNKNGSEFIIATTQKATSRMHSLYYRNIILTKTEENFSYRDFLKNISKIFVQEICFYGQLDEWERYYSLNREPEIDRF